LIILALSVLIAHQLLLSSDFSQRIDPDNRYPHLPVLEIPLFN
jgi:hypothetical protein